MNVDPPKEFDPSEALSLFAEPDSERYGLSNRTFFYLLISCRAVENFSESSFMIDKVFAPPGLTPSGCWVEFVIRQAFWIDVSPAPARVRLWTASADNTEAKNRYLVYDGDASDPKAWESLLVEIGRVEKFGVFMNHADTLRKMWTEWLAERRRRDDERGW